MEEEIHKLENRDEELNELLMDEAVFTDPSKLIALNKEKKEVEERLEELMMQWEELAE